MSASNTAPTRSSSPNLDRRPARRQRVASQTGSFYNQYMAAPNGQTDSAVKERVETKKQEPTLFKVLLLNDDYTTMEFVIEVLESVFQKSPAEAYRIMMHVHVNGHGIAGMRTRVESLGGTFARTEEHGTQLRLAFAHPARDITGEIRTEVAERSACCSSKIRAWSAARSRPCSTSRPT